MSIVNPSSVTNKSTISQPAVSVWPRIQALRIVIRTRWMQPTLIPGAVLANVLRGALGLTLRKLVCPEEFFNHDCAPCPLYRDCAFGQVFMPTPPSDATQLRLQQDLPRPFVIEPPGLHPDDRATADGLTFRVVLFGSAMDRLPYFISALDRLGADGMGRDRIPFQIEQISANHPHGDEPLLVSGSNTISLPRKVITTDDLLNTPWPVDRSPSSGASDVRRRVLARMGIGGIGDTKDTRGDVDAGSGDSKRPRMKIKFVTPLLLKSGSGIDDKGNRVVAREVRDRPPFGVLIRRLRDRLSSLCAFFGTPWTHPDFAALGTMADAVELVESQTTWLTRNRHSTRTGHTHEISGLVGHATYAFPTQESLDALAPLLKFGELIHVGKNAPWGNGGITSVIHVKHSAENPCE